jgi:hypothetical protein
LTACVATALALAALLACAGEAPAQTVRTSVTVSSEAVMPSVINSMPVVPVGTVVGYQAGTVPDDVADWLECDGQAIPALPKYAKLIAIMGPNVPDYNETFLRSTTDVALVNVSEPDSIKSHDVQTPGQLATVNGMANPQPYIAPALFSGPVGTTDAGAVPGSQGAMTGGGGLSGACGGLPCANVQPVVSTYAGAGNPALGGLDETAPKHTFVRYFVRAVQ